MNFGLSDIDINTIRDILGKYPSIEKALIFGSRATGKHKKGSDIDIALIGDGLKDILWRIHDELDEQTGMPYLFDIVDYSITTPELRSEIDSKGKMIFENTAHV
jgi:predicted nucleotidyltransferase